MGPRSWGREGVEAGIPSASGALVWVGLFKSCLYHFIHTTLQVTRLLGALVSSAPIKMSVYAV